MLDPLSLRERAGVRDRYWREFYSL